MKINISQLQSKIASDWKHQRQAINKYNQEARNPIKNSHY